MQYRLKRVHLLSEIANLINNPYHKPDVTDGRAKEQFRTEYEEVDSFIRAKLEEFGSIDSFGHAEFSMGNPWNSSRKIGITFNTEQSFSEALIKVLWTAVQGLPVDYLLVLSGEYVPGGGNFYICIRKGSDVLGYEPHEGMLRPFGFS